MRFTLVGPATEENLAVGYLSAALRAAGHAVHAVWFDGAADPAAAARSVLASKPDAVGLSIGFQLGAPGFLALARALRAAGFPGHLVAGGHFASLAAEELLRRSPALDSVLCGEADESLALLAAALESGAPPLALPGIVLRDGRAPRSGPPAVKPRDLDALPFPVREIPATSCAGVPSASLVASRGCRGRCSFCSIAAFGALAAGPARRERSATNVAREMGCLWRERAVRFFVFQDDDFLPCGRAAGLERTDELRRAFAAEGLPPVALAIKARPDDIDRDVLAGLRRLGLVQVFLGVETASSRGLRAMARGVTPTQVRTALEALRAAGVLVAANLLLWEPDVVLDDLRANLELLAAFPEQLFNFGRTEPYEGAPLTRRLARQGRLLGDWSARDYRVQDDGARVALEIFASTLAHRCRPDGAIPLAQRLGTSAAVASRLLDPARMAPSAREARAAIGRLAASNRVVLERIVDLSQASPAVRGDGIARLARELRDADAVLLAELRDVLRRIESSANEAARPAVRRSTRNRPLRFAVAAAAGALACSQPQGQVAQPSPGQTADAEAPATEASGGAAVAANDVEGVNLRLSTEQRYTRGGPCRPPTELPSAVTAEIAADPSAGAIQEVAASGGRIERAVVAPDGTRAVVSLLAGTDIGEGRLDIRIRRPDGSTVVRFEPFYFANGHAFATDQERQLFLAPPPPPYMGGRMGCDPPGPMPVMPYTPREMLGEDGRVAFAAYGGAPSGWATTISFAVGVTGVESGSVEPLDATCEVGRVTVAAATGDERMPPGWFAGTFTPYGPDGRAELREGTFACTLSFRLTGVDGDGQTLSGRLKVRVAADGTVTLGEPPTVVPSTP